MEAVDFFVHLDKPELTKEYSIVLTPDVAITTMTRVTSCAEDHSARYCLCIHLLGDMFKVPH